MAAMRNARVLVSESALRGVRKDVGSQAPQREELRAELVPEHLVPDIAPTVINSENEFAQY